MPDAKPPLPQIEDRLAEIRDRLRAGMPLRADTAIVLAELDRVRQEGVPPPVQQDIDASIALAVMNEREACARVADEFGNPTAHKIADAIRSRGLRG